MVVVESVVLGPVFVAMVAAVAVVFVQVAVAIVVGCVSHMSGRGWGYRNQ